MHMRYRCYENNPCSGIFPSPAFDIDKLAERQQRILAYLEPRFGVNEHFAPST